MRGSFWRVQAGRHIDRFADLRDGGRALANALTHYRGHADAVVLGIARGGVPAAVEVACALELPLDVLVPRRLLAAREDGTATSAVMVAGTLTVDPELERRISAAGPGARAGVGDLLSALDVRDTLCRGVRAPLNVRGRTVLLVDNGIHTGATMRVAIRALRRLDVGCIVVAAPVAAPSALSSIAEVSNEIVILAGSDPFGHVGLWYSRLDVPDFDVIAQVMANSGRHF